MRSLRLTDAIRERILVLHREGLKATMIERRVPVTVRTVRRVIKEEKERLAQQQAATA